MLYHKLHCSVSGEYGVVKEMYYFPLPPKVAGYLQEHSWPAAALKMHHAPKWPLCSEHSCLVFPCQCKWPGCTATWAKLPSLKHLHSLKCLSQWMGATEEKTLRAELSTATLTFRRWPVCIGKSPQRKLPSVVRKLHGSSISHTVKLLCTYLVQGWFCWDRWEVALPQWNHVNASDFLLGFAHKNLRWDKTSFKKDVPH